MRVLSLSAVPEVAVSKYSPLMIRSESCDWRRVKITMTSFDLDFDGATLSKFKYNILWLHCKYFCGTQYCQLWCYVSHISLAVLIADDGTTALVFQYSVLPSVAMNTVNLVWET
jgi:hypothetical protein